MSVPAAPGKFRVLLISDSYPPVLGGSEIEAQRVSAAMISRGHQVHVLCSGGPPMPPRREWIDPAGVPVSILTRRSRGIWKDRMFALQVAYAIWRRRRSYDIVYFLMQGLHVAAGFPMARFLKKPIVVKIAGSRVIPAMRQTRAGRWELDWMQRWRLPVMILNDGMVEEALADGFVRDQLVWMPNPVDLDEFRPAESGEAEAWRESHGIPRDARVAIYVGRLSQEKGLRELIGGFARAARRLPEAVLILAGDGAMRPELEALAGQLQVNPAQIRFIGRVPASEIPFWLRASDVFALTSPSEGFSCALLEAMSVGLASAVSAIPANLQLVDDGVHGLTVPFDDENAFAEAVLRLFGDSDLRRSMSIAARQRVVDNYSTTKVIDRYEALFRSLNPAEQPAASHIHPRER
jgi:glycosyltransferase involved in cell wall biosynthesis